MAKLFIRLDGTIEGLYTDQVTLQELGTLHVTRATNVEFDIDKQEWTVTPPNGGKELYSDSNRGEALAWEKEYCEELLESGFRVSK